LTGACTADLTAAVRAGAVTTPDVPAEFLLGAFVTVTVTVTAFAGGLAVVRGGTAVATAGAAPAPPFPPARGALAPRAATLVPAVGVVDVLGLAAPARGATVLAVVLVAGAGAAARVRTPAAFAPAALRGAAGAGSLWTAVRPAAGLPALVPVLAGPAAARRPLVVTARAGVSAEGVCAADEDGAGTDSTGGSGLGTVPAAAGAGSTGATGTMAVRSTIGGAATSERSAAAARMPPGSSLRTFSKRSAISPSHVRHTQAGMIGTGRRIRAGTVPHKAHHARAPRAAGTTRRNLVVAPDGLA